MKGIDKPKEFDVTPEQKVLKFEAVRLIWLTTDLAWFAFHVA